MAALRAALIIPAAGMGRRMNAGINKTQLSLHGKTILQHTLELFASIEEIAQVVIACRSEEMADMARLLKKLDTELQWGKQWDIVEGGSERYLSVRNATAAVVEDVDVIAVHDAVRPLVEAATITRALETAQRHGAALVGVYAKDTIKVVNDDGIITSTPPRASLFQAQTPQVFGRDIFVQCNKDLTEGEHYTDDCSLVEAKGIAIRVVEGSYENIKITTPDDLIHAEAILASRHKSL